MAHNPKLTNLGANSAADAVTALANSGFIKVYDGAQPATADTAITTQVLLATLTFGATAFGSAVAGVATANSITSDSAADATGTAAWFRVYKTDGTTALWDGSVGTAGGGDLNFGTVSFVTNAIIEVTAFTYTQSKS
jgi:hypothetical protein